MLLVLDTAYADTAAADLRFALGLPALPALHALDVPGPAGARLQLRLLGASHQAILARPDGTLSETVACLPATGERVPERLVSRQLPGVRHYSFQGRVHRLDPAAFAAQVAALRGWGGTAHALVGEFPGAPGALTALRAAAGAGRVEWRTAHAYPETGELVETRTAVVLR